MRIQSPRHVLLTLTVINLLNYIDRFVLAAVLPRVQAEFSLSNFQAGLLGSAFMIGYMLASPVFGALGDRFARKHLLAAGIFLWSIATIASGFAPSFTLLLIFRVAVGIGEASYAAIAPTLIDDLYPKEKKSKMLAVFFMAIPVGAALGYILGGALEKAYGWRHAFYFAGAPGIALSVYLLWLHEPVTKAARHVGSLLTDFKTLWRAKHYRMLVMGYTAYTFAMGGFAFWAPKYVNEVLSLSLDKANFSFGILTVTTGLLGTLIGGFLGAQFLKRFSLPGYAFLCALTSLIALPFAALAFSTANFQTFMIFSFICEILLFLSTSPVNAALLGSVPVHLRATGMAMSTFTIHLFGDLISPAIIGRLADISGLRAGMSLFPIAIAASGLFWLWAWRVKVTPQAK